MASNEQLPFPSDGVQFVTEEQYRSKGWCCYDAAKALASIVLHANQLNMQKIRKTEWCTYDELCQMLQQRGSTSGVCS